MCIKLLLSICLLGFSVSKALAEPNDSASPSLSGSFLSGYYALSKGDTASARNSLEQLAKSDPNNIDVVGRLLIMQISDGDIDEAVETANILKKKDGHELIVDLLLAVDLAKHQKYKEAGEAIANTEVSQFSDVWLPIIKAWLENSEGSSPKPATIKSIFTKSKNLPNFVTYHVGLINEFNGHHDEAAKLYADAIRDLNKAPFRAIQAYIQQRARDDDRKALSNIIEKIKKSRPEMLDLLNSRYPYLNKLEDSHALPLEYLASNPKEGFAEVLFTMASLLYAVDATTDVTLYLRLVLHLRPDFPTAQLMLANIFEATNQNENALKIYDEFHPDNQLYVQSVVRKAYLLDKMGRSAEALSLLDKLGKTPEDLLDPIIARGDILRTKQKYAEAATQYSEAIAKIAKPDASNWNVFFARGASYERIGEFAKAEDDLKLAMKLAPNQPEVLNYLGYMWLTNGENKKKAFSLIERAYSLSPREAHIIDSYGWAHYLSGDLKKALLLLEEAAIVDPNEPAINDHLGDVYWHVGRKTEARFQWRRAIESTQDSDLQAVLNTKLKDGLGTYVYGDDSKVMVEEKEVDVDKEKTGDDELVFE